MAWRGGATREAMTRSVERRLASVAQQWRPTPAPPEALPDAGWAGIDWVGPDDSDLAAGELDAAVGLPGRSRRVALGPWTASAVRGLAVLVAIAVAVAAYWAWSGRPRAVADVPEVIATGVPVIAPASASAAPVIDHADPSTQVPSPSAPSADGPAAPATVVVHVAGLVATPGLVELPAGSRVADALVAAGGVTRRRAADSVNLARILVDGEQIMVADGASGASPAGAATAASSTASPVNLNAATVDDLDALPGIGPVLATRIVAWRVANGPFRSVDELGEVSGIGEVVLGQLRSLVAV